MLDKSIPYKDLIMKWDGNRQCLLPVCVPPGYRLRTWREGDQKNWARIQKEAGEFGDMTLEQTEAWFLQEYPLTRSRVFLRETRRFRRLRQCMR